MTENIPPEAQPPPTWAEGTPAVLPITALLDLFNWYRQNLCGRANRRPAGLSSLLPRHGLRSSHQADGQVRQGTEEPTHDHRADSVWAGRPRPQPHSDSQGTGTQLGAPNHRKPHHDRPQLASLGTRHPGRRLYQKLRNGKPAHLPGSHLRPCREETLGGNDLSKGTIRGQRNCHSMAKSEGAAQGGPL